MNFEKETRIKIDRLFDDLLKGGELEMVKGLTLLSGESLSEIQKIWPDDDSMKNEKFKNKSIYVWTDNGVCKEASKENVFDIVLELELIDKEYKLEVKNENL